MSLVEIKLLLYFKSFKNFSYIEMPESNKNYIIKLFFERKKQKRKNFIELVQSLMNAELKQYKCRYDDRELMELRHFKFCVYINVYANVLF